MFRKSGAKSKSDAEKEKAEKMERINAEIAEAEKTKTEKAEAEEAEKTKVEKTDIEKAVKTIGDFLIFGPEKAMSNLNK